MGRCAIICKEEEQVAQLTMHVAVNLAGRMHAHQWRLGGHNAAARGRHSTHQYPSTQTLWKNEMFPPRSCALSVTTAAPHHTIKNTAAKTSDA